MTYDQILNLLNQGFSPADVMALQQAPAPAPAPDTAPDPAPAPAPDPAPAPAPQPEPAPAWAEELNQSIKLMTNAMHANAIMQQQQPAPKTITADEALANIIQPPKPDKGKK